MVCFEGTVSQSECSDPSRASPFNWEATNESMWSPDRPTIHVRVGSALFHFTLKHVPSWVDNKSGVSRFLFFLYDKCSQSTPY